MERSISDFDLITAWGHVVEAGALLGRAIKDDVQATAELPGSWFEVLLRLSRSPAQRLPMTVLAGQVSFSSGGFTKLADRLEDAGLVQRQACPEDRRVTWMALSPQGAKKVETATAAHVKFLRSRVLGRLGVEGVVQLGELMRILRDAELGGDSAPPATPAPVGTPALASAPELARLRHRRGGDRAS